MKLPGGVRKTLIKPIIVQESPKNIEMSNNELSLNTAWFLTKFQVYEARAFANIK